jgi:hypothetical protein
MTAVSRLSRAAGSILAAGLVGHLDRPGQADVGVSGRRVAAQNYVARPWVDARAGRQNGESVLAHADGLPNDDRHTKLCGAGNPRRPHSGSTTSRRSAEDGEPTR